MRERRMNMVQTLVWIPISVIILILENYQNYRSSTITKILCSSVIFTQYKSGTSYRTGNQEQFQKT